MDWDNEVKMNDKSVCKWLVVGVILLMTQVAGDPSPQVWDVERLIRARNPDAWTSTTTRSTTWQTLRSITYNPLLEEGSVGSASIEEASLVKSFRPTHKSTPTSRGSAVTPGRISLLFCLLGTRLPHG